MSEARTWLQAARPATLWASVVPVLVGGGLAWGAGRESIFCVTAPCPAGERIFRWDAFFVTLIAALAMQVAANFSNDASDARRGADSGERIGPVRAVAAGLITPRSMWTGVGLAFGVAVACGVYLAVIAGPIIIVIGVVSILATLGYVGGPKPYGYRGLGELFVFVFFGIVATVGSRYVHDSTAPAAAWLLAIPVGLLATAILVANNIRDIETDTAAEKRTLAVLIGRPATARLYTGLVYGAFVAIALFAITGWTPRWTVLAILAVPQAVPIVRTVRTATDGASLIRALKGTARLQLIVGLLVALGAVIA